MSNGLILDGNHIAGGERYDGQFVFLNDISGYYNLAYSFIEDGAIPICYNGVNQFRADNGVGNVLVILDDLDSDADADVLAWLTAGFAQVTAALGVAVIGIVKISGSASVYYPYDSWQITMAAPISLNFSNNTAKYLFGVDNHASAVVLNLTAEHINNRPKFLGLVSNQFQNLYTFPGSTQVSLVASNYDELVIGYKVYIPIESQTLNFMLVRLNAPSVACPFKKQWAFVLNKAT